MNFLEKASFAARIQRAEERLQRQSIVAFLVLLFIAASGLFFGCCSRRPPVVDYRDRPADVHRLPSWQQVPRPAMEREA